MGRALFWLTSAMAVAACLVGLFYVWVSLKPMFDHKPTGATLTLAFYGLPWLAAGISIFLISCALRYFFRRRK